MPYKNLTYQYELVKEWRRNHPDYHKNYNRMYRKRKPWVKALTNILSRCIQKKSYYKRGIKNFLRMKDLEYLWYRDNAPQMEKPSLH